MQFTSPDYLPSLAGSHQVTVTVEAWRDGRLIEKALPVSGGSLTIDAGQSVRGTLSLSVADPDGRFTPRPDSALSPLGTELVVRAGMMRRSVTELFQLGSFVITKASTDESWRDYRRPDEPNESYMVSRGAVTTVDAADRMVRLQDARFVSRTQPASSGALVEIGRLLRGLRVPWEPPPVQDVPIPRTLTYDDDRLAAVQQLATLLGMEPVMKASGAMTLQATTGAAAVAWRIPRGTDTTGGVLVSMSRTLTRDGIHNAYVARGTAPDQRPLQAVAYDLSTPVLAWGGPFGQVPAFYESQFLTTQAQVQSTANLLMARERAKRLQTITVSCIANHALEVGDVVEVRAPLGWIAGRVSRVTWALGPGADRVMEMDVAVDPFVLAQVS